MKRSLLALSLTLVLTACEKSSTPQTESVSTQQPAANQTSTVAPVKTYSADAFFKTTSYSLASSDGYAWSSDSSKVLLSSDQTGVFNTYSINEMGTLTQLTESAEDAHFARSFFPNDDRLIVTADQGGNELNHVYVRELNGTLVDVTPGEKLKAFFGGWTADGSQFYVWHNGRDASSFDLYALDSKSYEASILFENPGFQAGPISHDDKWLALSKARTSADSDVYLVDLMSESKEPVLITEHEGNIAYEVYDFKPDNSALVYSTNEYGEFNQAWTYNLESGEKTELVNAEWDVSFLFYSESGQYRVHGVNADGLIDLSIFDTKANKEVELKGVPEGELGQIRFSRDESKIAFYVNSDTSPADIYITELGSTAKRLTTALNPEIDESDLVTATVERFTASDGVTIPGIMYKPKNASAENPVPALVLVHGGPGGQSTRGYRALTQHLVNNGYAIYAANNRGSSGYGKTFFHMDDKRHGQEDLRDIVEAGHYLRGLDWVDGNKVGVMGGSYGGYMTAAALAFHPEEFEVGINIFGVTNWFRTLQSIPEWWGAFREALFDEMGDPETDAERHRAISPLFHATNIVRPMLVVQGANDPRVLQAESDELVAAVKANNVPVEYVLFEDEGHGFLKKENRVTASNAYLAFLDKYLKGADAG